MYIRIYVYILYICTGRADCEIGGVIYHDGEAFPAGDGCNTWYTFLTCILLFLIKMWLMMIILYGITLFIVLHVCTIGLSDCAKQFRISAAVV